MSDPICQMFTSCPLSRGETDQTECCVVCDDTREDAIDPHKAGAKLDQGKPQPRLVLQAMPRAMMAIAEVATHDARKYAPHGWSEVNNGIERYTDANLCHLIAEGAETHDTDSGLPHAAHAAWNAIARLELMLREDKTATADDGGIQAKPRIP